MSLCSKCSYEARIKRRERNEIIGMYFAAALFTAFGALAGVTVFLSANLWALL